jgi:trk system potassium uptake protein TrkA
MHIIITGCGRVGSQLAQYLSYEGHDVVIIDRDQESFSRLTGGFNGLALTGAAFDEELLLQAGIEEADALAAVTNFDNTNLMVCEMATRIYKVPMVVTRLYNPEKRFLFIKMGVQFINGTTLVALSIMHKLLQRDLIIHQDRMEVGVRVVEFAVPWLSGQVAAGDLEEETEMRILALERRGRQMHWDAGTRLLVGDRVVMAVKSGAVKGLMEVLEGIGIER